MEPMELMERVEIPTKIRAGKDVIFADLGPEISLLNVQSGVYYTLNAVGASIWHLLQEATTFAAIKARLLEEYDVEEKQCERDLVRLIGELADHGLVEINPAAPAIK